MRAPHSRQIDAQLLRLVRTCRTDLVDVCHLCGQALEDVATELAKGFRDVAVYSLHLHRHHRAARRHR